MTVRDAFHSQSISCSTLGSPFMGRLMALAADRLTRETKVGRLCLDWEGDASSSGDSVPLRFGGALHRLVLTDQAPDLAEHYGKPGDDDVLWAAVEATMAAHEDTLIDYMQSPPQTNEIRRSVALVPALHMVAAETSLPLALLELGASAGLNLHCDQFCLTEGAVDYGPTDASVRFAPETTGTPPAPSDVQISSRRGVDLRPFDLSDADQSIRLLSYLWPDQPERVTNTRAAIDLAVANPVAVDADDAIAWLERQLDERARGVTTVMYHTVAWQYFPKSVQDRGEALIEHAGAAATPTAPLARFSMEADDRGRGAEMALTIWPDGECTMT